MLFEKITYGDDFPINIFIGQIEEYPIHYHQDTEFVCVLKGAIALKNGYCSYTLHEGDIFTNSSHEVHGLTSTGEDNLVAVIQISTRYFSQYFPQLSKACYRTYTNKEHTKRHDTLWEKLLRIILQYMVKSFSYKSECTYMMVDIIKYLDKYFNLFAFEDNMVINFESGNQITIDRISRIIGYIYEFHSDKITLDDLAEMEHLSTFYLSHIIKACTGMNFREFLCFARVEWSEIDLLETNKKVSKVARDVGFSTTSYYEKYFEKWFGTDPQTYREQHMPLVLSDLRQPVIHQVSDRSIVSIIKKSLSSVSTSDSSNVVMSNLNIELNVSQDAPAIFSVDHKLDLMIRPEDFEELGYSIFSLIKELDPGKITIISGNASGIASGEGKANNSALDESNTSFNEADDRNDETADRNDTKKSIALLENILADMGYTVSVSDSEPSVSVSSYGFDSIAFPIFTLNRLLRSRDEWIKVILRDPGSKDQIAMGYPAAVTASGVKKPVFFAYQILSKISGDVIYWGKQYIVLRSNDGKSPYLSILAYNFDDNIYNLCVKDSTAYNAKSIIDDFKREVNLSINMALAQGMYTVIRYSMSGDNGLFSYISSFDSTDGIPLFRSFSDVFDSHPALDIYVEDARATFNFNFLMKGAGLQFAIIHPNSK